MKARETGRATSQGAFIKAGCPEARISITLWNEGPEAYLPETYGKAIIIERRIGKSASYTIRNAEGRKVGNRRDELEAILDALQINAANPITVMTQVKLLQSIPCCPHILHHAPGMSRAFSVCVVSFVKGTRAVLDRFAAFANRFQTMVI